MQVNDVLVCDACGHALASMCMHGSSANKERVIELMGTEAMHACARCGVKHGHTCSWLLLAVNPSSALLRSAKAYCTQV